MKRAIYKAIDRETAAWDLDASSRRYVNNNKNTRKFHREMRKHARKRINRWMITNS